MSLSSYHAASPAITHQSGDVEHQGIADAQRREDRGCAPITLLSGAEPQTPERYSRDSRCSVRVVKTGAAPLAQRQGLRLGVRVKPLINVYAAVEVPLVIVLRGHHVEADEHEYGAHDEADHL